MSLIYKLQSGKNSKLQYYICNYLRMAIPKLFYRKKRRNEITRLSNMCNMKIIMKRVNYYNRLNIPIILPADSPTLSQHRFTHEGKVYFFDTYEYIRWFKPQLHWLFFPGDITHIPPSPAIVKSRP
ncbi:MAG: lipopolysaccharide biosynthesis protein, partial [Bacteroidales bacterium]